jgi:putative sterol carrier protein
MEAARKLREEYAGQINAQPTNTMRANLVVTEVPFGEGSLDAHIDTTGGEVELETGHLDNPDLTLTVDYATAKAIFIDNNPQAGMQAFMSGKVKVQGDMTKLMAMQTAAPDPAAV